MMVRVFANGSGDLGSIPGRVIAKTQNWYLMPPCLTLSILRYGSRVKWSNLEKGVAPPQHLVVVAIENGAFRSLSTTVANFTFYWPIRSGNKQKITYSFYQQLAARRRSTVKPHLVQ